MVCRSPQTTSQRGSRQQSSRRRQVGASARHLLIAGHTSPTHLFPAEAAEADDDNPLLLCTGAAWLDINCGCPIYEATKRGLGAALLRKPTKLAKMVAGIAAQVDLPITVKIRTGQRQQCGLLAGCAMAAVLLSPWWAASSTSSLQLALLVGWVVEVVMCCDVLWRAVLPRAVQGSQRRSSTRPGWYACCTRQAPLLWWCTAGPWSSATRRLLTGRCCQTWCRQTLACQSLAMETS